MKETGLMFKAPLVRAILTDLKTQTRRPLKIQPPANFMHGDVAAITNGTQWAISNSGFGGGTKGAWPPDPEPGLSCPWGQPGDRIYVRETWKPDPPCDGTWAYTAWAGCRQGQIEGVPKRFRAPEHCMYAASSDADLVWTPSIHMPKWAARIWLEVNGVRVERLQDISEADAIKEGAPPSHPSIDRISREYGYSDFPRSWFAQTWESTGGDWDANPWVWVIDFKRIEKH